MQEKDNSCTKAVSSSKKRKKSRVPELEPIRETVDSGEDIEVFVGDSETPCLK